MALFANCEVYPICWTVMWILTGRGKGQRENKVMAVEILFH